MTRAVSLALALALVFQASCRSDSADRRFEPVVHLADRPHMAAGDPSSAAVPRVIVADDVRPTLGATSWTSLGMYRVAANRRRLVVRVPIPERLQGGPLRLAATVLLPDVRIVEARPRVVRPARAEEILRLTLDGPPRRGKIPVYVAGLRVPERTHTTEPVTVPADARLRFGIGVAETEFPPRLPAAVFTVRVLDGEHEEAVFQGRLDPRRPEDHGWVDYEADLGRWAGRSVRLRFETSGEATDARVPFIDPVWGDPTIVAPAAAGPPPRSVLLVSLDTLRADHLGCYRYQRPTSPAIDRFAAEGTIFERTFAHYPSTAGSHMTLFTSLYPCVHRVVGNLGPDDKLRPDAHTLAEILRARGYETAAFTDDGLVSSIFGFARGFGSYVENRTGDVGQPTGQASVTFPRARAWIRAHVRVPWFVFLHTYQVHDPYTPPAGYREQVAPEPGEDKGAEAAALYDGEIRYTDELLEPILAATLDVPPPEPIVIILSDHGEQFGEHGLLTHGNSLYDTLLHVPLIVHAPGLVPSGKRIPDDVGLIDVVPTILDLLHLPASRWHQGRSLVPLLEGGTLERLTLFASLEPLVAIRNGQSKWIINLDTQRANVFVPIVDPSERTPTRKDRSLQVPQLLAKYHAACDAPPPPSAGAPEPEPAVRQKLKALGYTE